MATARKPFVRLETSLVREPWDHELKGTLCLLMCVMGDRWARDRLTAEEASRITLTPGQMTDITGRTHLRHARDRLRSLARHVSMKVTTEGRHTTVEWLKWPITQELASRGREFKARPKPESAPAPAPAPSPAQSQAEDQDLGTPAATPPNEPPVTTLARSEQPTLLDGLEESGAIERHAAKLVNLLARYKGTPEEKLAWLTDNLHPMVCDVAATPGLEPENYMPALKRRIMSWYMWRLKNPDGNKRPAPESFEQAAQRRADEWLQTL